MNYYYHFFRSTVSRFRKKIHSSLFWLYSSKYTKESSLHIRTRAKCFRMFLKGSTFSEISNSEKEREILILRFSQKVSAYTIHCIHV